MGCESHTLPSLPLLSTLSWFDGGLPSDPVFGAGISSLLSKLQPNAATFNSWPIVNSTAIRWIGTEGGAAPDPTWSSGSCGRGNEQCTDCAGGNGGAPDDADWCAAEVDSTLQLGDTWFYVAGLGLHPLSDLQASYHASLGRNSNWLLDIAPPPSGTVAPAHAALYSEFGAWLRGCYGAVPVARGSFAPGARALSIALPAGARFDRVRLTEDVTGGQFVRAYTVESTGPPRAGAGPPGRAGGGGPCAMARPSARARLTSFPRPSRSDPTQASLSRWIRPPQVSPLSSLCVRSEAKPWSREHRNGQ